MKLDQTMIAENYNQFELKLILFVIYKMPEWNDSFNLIRIVSMKFDILPLPEMLDKLLFLEYLTKSASDTKGVDKFFLTQEGTSFLKNDYNLFIEWLEKSYPERKDLVNALVNRNPSI